MFQTDTLTLALTSNLDLQFQESYGRDPYIHASVQGQKSVGSKVKVEKTDRRTEAIALGPVLTLSVKTQNVHKK